MSVYSVDAHTLDTWIKQNNALVVDVREPDEHASGHIIGSFLLPLGAVSESLLPDADGKKLVVYCRSGKRSAMAASRLNAENSDLEMYNLQGGISAWHGAGYAVSSADSFAVKALDVGNNSPSR